MESPSPLRRYLERLETVRAMSANTLRSYGLHLHHFADWLRTNRQHDWNTATGDDVTAYCRERAAGSSPSTAAYALGVIKRFYEWGVKHAGMPQNPIPDDLKVPVKQSTPKTVPTTSQFLAMRAALVAKGNLRNICIFELLAGGGLRMGELLSVRPKHFTFGAKAFLTVDSSEMACKGHAERKIPITPHCAATLAPFLLGKDANEPLFTVGETTVKKLLASVRLPELEGFSAHSLRHFWASCLYFKSLNGKSCDIVAVSHGLGHSNLATTSGYLKQADFVVGSDAEWQTWAYGKPCTPAEKAKEEAA